MRVVFHCPGSLTGTVLLVPDRFILARVKLDVVLHVRSHSDKVGTIPRRHLHAQPFEILGRKLLATIGSWPEGRPEQNVRVRLRRDALTQPVVQGGRVVHVPFLVERTGDVGRVLAERELRGGLAFCCQEREQQEGSGERVHQVPSERERD